MRWLRAPRNGTRSDARVALADKLVEPGDVVGDTFKQIPAESLQPLQVPAAVPAAMNAVNGRVGRISVQLQVLVGDGVADVEACGHFVVHMAALESKRHRSDAERVVGDGDRVGGGGHPVECGGDPEGGRGRRPSERDERGGGCSRGGGAASQKGRAAAKENGAAADKQWGGGSTGAEGVHQMRCDREKAEAERRPNMGEQRAAAKEGAMGVEREASRPRHRRHIQAAQGLNKKTVRPVGRNSNSRNGTQYFDQEPSKLVTQLIRMETYVAPHSSKKRCCH